MGEVFRARDTKLGLEVALKILPREIAGDPARVARFRREALAVAALNHPNIVTLYAAEEAEGLQFLTMELVEGETLRSVMRPRGVQLGRFFDLAIPLAQAISSAHEKGITHRDLKPANVLLDQEGRPKILDFGLARMIENATPGDATAVIQPELTTDGTVLGTVGYMSPEQAEGRETDARSDIFSLGVILYELATGSRPFEGDTNAQILTSLLRDEPAPVLEVGMSTRNYEAAMDLNPRDPTLILELLGQYVIGSRWTDAERLDRIAEDVGVEVPYRTVLTALMAVEREGNVDKARARIDAFPDPTDPWVSELATLVEVYAGNYDAALARIAACREPIIAGGATSRTVKLWRGLIHQLAGDEDAARTELEAAASELEQVIATRPDHFRFESALGIAYAALGREAEARAHASKALEQFPLEEDYVWGPSLQMDVALIHAMIGDLDQAMAYAERSLSWADYYTGERVALDPWLKALMTHPDFEEMASRAVARRAALFERVG